MKESSPAGNRHRWLTMLAPFALLLVLALPGTVFGQSIQITTATWNDGSGTLAVTGTYQRSNSYDKRGTTITVLNPVSGDVLGTTKTDRRGNWSFSTRQISVIPCRVQVTAGQSTAEAAVQGAPSDCDGGGTGGGTGGGSGGGTGGGTGGSTGANVGTVADQPVLSGQYRLVAFNDLGMHCYDKDFSVFGVLPPFNVVHAQVIQTGTTPRILDDTQVTVTYQAVSDLNGSFNTSSAGKTNFWDYVLDLFGVNPPVDEGIMGATMPGANNTPQPMSIYEPDHQWFTAFGIPITDTDDQGQYNNYPMLRIQAFDKSSGDLLASTDIVVPVSDEMHCSKCHSNGGEAADAATANQLGVASWSTSNDPEIQYRENVLIIHDAINGTSLVADKPVMCATCHYSPALDLTGAGPQGPQTYLPSLSKAIHTRHGKTRDGQLPDANNPAIIQENGTNSCYSCHPGSTTQCLRGAMGSAGINCQNCHGGLLAVGAEFASRTPWQDEPKCQSCHTGDALDNFSGAIRETMTYDPNDPAAHPRTVTNKRFAEQDNTLFRNSHGHGDLACEACHGSTHAIWPSAEANDNVTATLLQGHDGTIFECTTCHDSSMGMTMDGPHGMHNVNDSTWSRNHSTYYRQNPASCQTCHGQDLNGTVLSRAAADRQLSGDDHRSVSVTKGTPIGCGLCHGNPLNGGGGD